MTPEKVSTRLLIRASWVRIPHGLLSNLRFPITKPHKLGYSPYNPFCVLTHKGGTHGNNESYTYVFGQ